jgi:hypothetical protein
MSNGFSGSSRMPSSPWAFGSAWTLIASSGSRGLTTPSESQAMPVISMFGGKSWFAGLYDVPRYDVISEPFAGGAGYSLLYRNREVHLYDKDPRISAAWRFALGGQRAADDVENLFPEDALPGDRVEDLIDTDAAPLGLVEIVRSWAAPASYPGLGERHVVSLFAANKDWSRIKKNLLIIIPEIAHWTIEQADYLSTPNLRCTHFIDPPYQRAGCKYRCGSKDIKYEQELRPFVFSRRGQLIVCEQADNTWLPEAVTLTNRRRGVKSPLHKTDVGEVVYER